MKPRVVFEFLCSRRTETDRVRAFSQDQKADGIKSTPIYMPHHSGGDNTTKVRRWSACRNSFRDIFLYDPFAHNLKHTLRFQVLPKNTRGGKKKSLVLELSATLLPSSGIIMIIIINPLNVRVVGAPQMILQPVFSIFPCSPLPSGTCRTLGLSIP